MTGDWGGALIVAGMGAALTAVAYVPRLNAWASGRVEDQVAEVLGPLPVDHAPCKADDCDRDVCYCQQPTPCPGASEALCGHGDMVCEDHRLECTDCFIDYVSDADYEPGVA